MVPMYRRESDLKCSLNLGKLGKVKMKLSLYLLKAPRLEGIRVSGRTSHAFVSSVLDRGEPSAVRPRRLTPGERVSYR